MLDIVHSQHIVCTSEWYHIHLKSMYISVESDCKLLEVLTKFTCLTALLVLLVENKYQKSISISPYGSRTSPSNSGIFTLFPYRDIDI